jgi:hypothetical protein
LCYLILEFFNRTDGVGGHAYGPANNHMVSTIQNRLMDSGYPFLVVFTWHTRFWAYPGRDHEKVVA